jgi:hypothetical protein
MPPRILRRRARVHPRKPLSKTHPVLVDEFEELLRASLLVESQEDLVVYLNA